MHGIISYKMCAVKVRNAKLRNYLKSAAIAILNWKTIFIFLMSWICIVIY